MLFHYIDLIILYNDIAQKSVTITYESYVKYEYGYIKQILNTVFCSLELRITAQPGEWTLLFTMPNNRPWTNITIPCIKTGDGTYAGMVTINAGGQVMIYAKQSFSNVNVAFSFTF